MSKSRYELDPERLATTDESGHRVYLHPEDVRGKWKTRRTFVYWALILIYLVLPWFYINGKPALLIDITQREFTLLGFTLHGMEPILFFLMLVAALFFIAFITSLLGRVWCGWACPQTVFIQAIFLGIERLVEGRAYQREVLEASAWTLSKITKRLVKWLLYVLVSLHIAHTFIGYFVGPRELFWITLETPLSHPTLFAVTMIFSLVVLFDFGWFREQFCLVACPYGRIQSVMMDENSLVVAYDAKRGEPRRGSVARSSEGDCVNCYHCVKVCPTGIDIRRGTQLECIACTQCIDACDEIMAKLKKPKGLIRYSSDRELQGNARRRITVRSSLYLTAGLVFIVGLMLSLRSSTQLSAVLLRGRGEPFQVTTNGAGEVVVTNHFTVQLKHQGRRQFSIELRSQEPAVELTQPVRPWKINQAEVKNVVFFRFNKNSLTAGSRTLHVELYDHLTQSVVATKEVSLVGPVE